MPNYKILRELRKERKISAEILASYAGYDSRQSIYDIENGKIQNISHKRLSKICELLNVDSSVFYPGENMVAEEMQLYKPKVKLEEIRVSSDRMAKLLEENRQLWRENSLLKTIIIEHNIDITFTK